MLSEHRHYLIEQSIGATVFNFLLNGAIAWVLFRPLETVPLLGDQSILIDTIIMGFLLPFLVCLIVTGITRRRIQSGAIPGIKWIDCEHPFLNRMPKKLLSRSILVGLVSAVIVTPLAMGVLVAFDVSELDLLRFVVFKSTLAAMLSAIVTPAVALRAMADRDG